ILQIVAIHRGDYRVPESEIGDRGGDASRFLKIVFRRLAARYGTERTGARTDIAQDHEGRRPVAAPAFGNVRTQRVFADRVQLMGAENAPDVEIVFAARN